LGESEDVRVETAEVVFREEGARVLFCVPLPERAGCLTTTVPAVDTGFGSGIERERLA
jgi:hypothetical protein